MMPVFLIKNQVHHRASLHPIELHYVMWVKSSEVYSYQDIGISDAQWLWNATVPTLCPNTPGCGKYCLLTVHRDSETDEAGDTGF